MFWKSVFWEVAKNACLESFQTCYIFFGCSASLPRIPLNICEVHQCRTSPFYLVLLTTWPTVCTSKVFISHEKDLEAGQLSAKQENNQMSLLISFLPPAPTSLFQRHSKNNLYIECTEVFLLQKSSPFHMDHHKGFLDICPIPTFWPVRKQATDSVFVWLLVLQSSGSALFAACIHNFFSDQLFKTFI